MEQLQIYRQEIDLLDKQILELLGERFQYVRKVAEFKKEHNLPPLQPGRWQDVLNGAKSYGGEKGLEAAFIGVVWNTIHEFALVLEEKITGQ